MHPPSDGETLATPESSTPAQAASGTQAYEDGQDQCKVNPSDYKFVAITVAICLLFTLVGLVSLASINLLVAAPDGEGNPGQQHHCNSRSSYDQVFWYSQRHCVVHFHLVRDIIPKNCLLRLTWTLSTHVRVISAYIWQTLYHDARKGPAPRKPSHIFHGTLLCALAPSSPVFILGRAITGVATAAVVAGAFA